MPVVTVLGAHSQTVALTYDSAANAILAQSVANAIDAGIGGGTIHPADSAFGPPPPVPSGIGEFVQSGPGVTVLPHNYGYLVVTDSSPAANIFGNGDANEQVIAGSGKLNFFASAAPTGSGTIVTGGGNNLISIPVSDAGAWSITTGSGNNFIRALGGGDDTITTGTGNNQIQLGSGNDFLFTSGSDTILAGSGSETINATGSDVVHGNSSRLWFEGTSGGGATVYGGSGSDTVFGGSGNQVMFGGTAGNNFLQAGSGAATLFGGGAGDQLFAGGSSAQALHAAGGNETLFGGFASGNDTFFGGSGNTQITTSNGNSTVVAGIGAATVAAAGNNTVLNFIFGAAGGTELVQNLTDISQVHIALSSGYGGFPGGVTSQSTSSGSLVVTLSDNTKITFANISSGSLTGGNFS